MNNLSLILGAPGTGKTTTLLKIVAEEAARGVPLSEIAYVSYTKIAVEDAARKLGTSADDMPYFRTIHSLAYHELGMQRDDVMHGGDWKAFSELIGERVSGNVAKGTDIYFQGSRGDACLRIADYARTTMMTLDDAYHELDEQVDWFVLKRFVDALDKFKAKLGKRDYTDMLRDYAECGSPVNVRVAVIDEGQDLTRAQWAVVRRAFANAERIYVGGDDDQAIYRWSGADVDTFLSLSTAPTTLGHSHRLSAPVHALAAQIASRISHRYPKQFAASEHAGYVERHYDPVSVDLRAYPGSWFLLARNRYHVDALERYVRLYGINYTMHDTPAVSPNDVAAIYTWEHLRTGKIADVSAADARKLLKALDLDVPMLKELRTYTYADLGIPSEFRTLPWHEALHGISRDRLDFYLTCLRRGEKLTTPPRIHLKTIHGVKGAEADHVMLLSDVSEKTAKGYRLAPDNEHRVFYVGATRAKIGLHIILPRTQRFYPLP